MTILTLPRLGETMEEARVTDWLKAPGEAFKRGEVLLEVETDKTVVEVPALQDGTLIAHLVVAGEMVALDQPIAEVKVAGETDALIASTPQAAEAVTKAAMQSPTAQVTTLLFDRLAASPRARALSRVAGVDLGAVRGTGRRGRITGQDVRDVNPAGTQRDGVEKVHTRHGLIAIRRYRALGGATGAPVVLLHGLYDTGRGWRDLPQRLARAGHPVLVPDLPGHGESDARATDIASVVDVLADALARVVPDGPLRLVGHSLGAVLAAQLAPRLGARLEKLILIAPAGLGPRMNPDFLDLMAGAATPAALARATALLNAGPLSDTAMQAELDLLVRRRDGLTAVAGELARSGVQQTDISAHLLALTQPVVAVFGLADQIIDWRDCASLPARVAIHLVPAAGHLPHSTAPDLICDLICTHISVSPTPKGTTP